MNGTRPDGSVKAGLGSRVKRSIEVAIELDKDVQALAIQSIQNYFAQKRDEELGNLEAQFLLDFFLEQIGPLVYNRAVRDAQALVQDKLMDIDGELFEPEPSSRGS